MYLFKYLVLYTIYCTQTELVILMAQPYVLGLNLAEIYVTREM